MSSPDRGRLAVAGCCLVAALGYSGAVTTAALATYVLPAVLIVAAAALLLTRMAGPGPAAGLTSLLALALAQGVNVASGEFNGPVARSTFIAGIGTAIAVSFARRWSPGWVCLPVSGVLAGSLFLGAAGEVIPVLAALVVALGVTVPMLERARRRPARGVRLGWMTPVLALLAGAVALGAAHLETTTQHRQPKVFAIAQVDRGIEPLHDATPSPQTAPDTNALPSANHAAPAATGLSHRLSLVLLVLSALAAALVAALLVRLLLIAWAWRRLRRRLTRGTPEQATVGAWTWAVLRLRAQGIAIPDSLSPDSFAVRSSALAVSAAVAEPMADTAQWAVGAAFSSSPHLAGANREDAWLAARAADELRRGELPRWRRLLTTVRSIPALPVG